uniref:Leucine-rich repeat-containing protein 40 n=1 Tax=Macrostomum lignano TaxID=282301 RepID=A0A1I8HGD5_9PLAT
MPLFGRKQTEAGKRRLERKLYLAQESESSPFDLSECELTEVPTGVYTQIRVLRKEALLLNDNWLTSLGPESKLTSLANLRVLDLRNNELTDLPNNIGCLTCLQVLSLDRNKLTWLPASMQSMRNLQTLGLRDNRLKSLPSEIFLGLASLKLLDIAGNPMRQLPRTICQARTLENLTLSPQGFTYPSKEAGVQYEPPSRFALHILPSPEVESSGGGPGMGGGGNSGPLLKELANDY